jgi:two-component system chemotaxis response regulator CheV
MLLFEGIEKIQHSATVLYADDSAVARKQIEKTLDLLGVKHMGSKNGEEAWQKLQELAQRAKETGVEIKSLINIILTDIEMPGMDGYVLTRKIKQDPRFKDVPVIMHSSLSADANVALGKSVGVNAYVPKFDPRVLARTILPYLEGDTSAIQSFIDKG